MPDVITSKLYPPYAGIGLIDRSGLKEHLHQAEKRQITLITGPAGYGKTVLMVQLAAKIAKPLLWYQLDEYDNDPAVFLQHFVAGSERHLPGFGDGIIDLVAQGSISVRLKPLLRTILARLAEAPQGLVIVLDDYHVVHDSVVNTFVQELINHLPQHIQVVIASRATPDISLTRPELKGEVCFIGMDELRFTRQEIVDLYKRGGKEIPAETVALLERKTGGWPAALRLLAGARTDCSNPVAANPTQTIYDYLATEVFDRQPEGIRDFLLATSVLQTMTPGWCDTVLNRKDSRDIFKFLLKQQLFLIPLAGGEEIYRYHQLFREFLLDRLGERRNELQRRVGLLAWEKGELESAIELLLSAGCGLDVVPAIREASKTAFGRGCWQTVARWLEELPGGTISHDPWLSLYRAKIEVYRGRLDEAERWLEQAVNLFSATGEVSGGLESRFLKARLLRCRGKIPESLAILTELGEEAADSSGFEFPLEKALCLMLSGRLQEAEAVLTEAFAAIKGNEDSYGMAHLLEGLGTIQYMLGNYPKALQTYQAGAEMLPERMLPSYYAQDSISTIYQDWGETDRAFDYAKRNVAIKESLGLAEALPSAYIQLAGLYVDRKSFVEAEQYFERAIHMIRENKGESFYLALNLVFWGQCLSLQGKWIEARIKAEEALGEAKAQGGLALAVCRAVAAAVFVQTGSVREGEEMLSQSIDDLEAFGFKKALCYAYAIQAWLTHSEGMPSQAKDYAQKCLELAARLNYLQLFITHFDMLQPVLQIGLFHGIEVTYVQRSLVRVGERAVPLLAELTGHSDPEVRMRTIAPLAEIGGSRAYDVIRKLANDSDVRVHQLARLTTQRLGIIGRSGIQLEVAAVPLHIQALGPLRIFIRGSEVTANGWRTAKTRELLSYLVHQGEPVTKDKLVEDLWPEADLSSATVIFHTTLYNLRRVLDNGQGMSLVSYGNRRYQLRSDSFQCDCQHFQELVAAGLRSTTEPEAAVTTLEQAVALYRGDYLEDIDYPWVLPRQESLKHLCVEARVRLAKHYQQLQNYSRAVFHLQMVEQYDPFAEDVHAALLTVYAKQGNRQAIQQQYRRLEAILKSELGLSPSSAIQALFQQLIG